MRRRGELIDRKGTDTGAERLLTEDKDINNSKVLPVLKATIHSYSIEASAIYFKLIVSLNRRPYRKLKKSYDDFLYLDQILTNKYAV